MNTTSGKRERAPNKMRLQLKAEWQNWQKQDSFSLWSTTKLTQE